MVQVSRLVQSVHSTHLHTVYQTVAPAQQVGRHTSARMSAPDGAGDGGAGRAAGSEGGGTSTSRCCAVCSGLAPEAQKKGSLLRCSGLRAFASAIKYQLACVKANKEDLTGLELDVGVPHTKTEYQAMMKDATECGKLQHVLCHKAGFEDEGRAKNNFVVRQKITPGQGEGAPSVKCVSALSPCCLSCCIGTWLSTCPLAWQETDCV